MIDANKMALFVKHGKSDSKELIAENLNLFFTIKRLLGATFDIFLS